MTRGQPATVGSNLAGAFGCDPRCNPFSASTLRADAPAQHPTRADPQATLGYMLTNRMPADDKVKPSPLFPGQGRRTPSAITRSRLAADTNLGSRRLRTGVSVRGATAIRVGCGQLSSGRRSSLHRYGSGWVDACDGVTFERFPVEKKMPVTLYRQSSFKTTILMELIQSRCVRLRPMKPKRPSFDCSFNRAIGTTCAAPRA